MANAALVRLVPKLSMFFGSAAVGSVVLLNQVGGFLPSTWPIAFLSPLWEINVAVAGIGFHWIVVGLLAVVTACDATLAGNRQIQQPFRVGFLLGFFLLPLILVGLGAVLAVLWVVYQVLRFVALVIGAVTAFLAPLVTWLLTPFRWLATNVLEPVLRFLSIPFVWIWDSFLQEVVRIVLIPFEWLFENLVRPVLAFLVRYLLQPIVIAAIAVLGAGIVLLPFALVGRTLITSFQAAFWSRIDPQGSFAQGVGTGFIVLDAVTMLALDVSGIARPAPALFILLALVIPITYFIRAASEREQWKRSQWDPVPVSARAQGYFKTSGHEAMVACTLLPVVAAIAVYASDE